MILKEVTRKINELFTDAVADIGWSKPSEIANRIAAELHETQMRILERLIKANELSKEERIIAFEDLLTEAQNTIQEIVNAESLLDLTTSDQGDSENEELETAIKQINYNIDARIREIVRRCTGHENDDRILIALISYLDPTYPDRNFLEQYEMEEDIIDSFIEKLEDARLDVENLTVLRLTLIQQAENVYINANDNIWQINPEAEEEERMEILQEIIAQRDAELAEIIIDSEHATYVQSPHLKEESQTTTDPREILNEVYDYILENQNEDYLFATIDLSIAEINTQIYLYLDQVLLNEGMEYTVIPEIIAYILSVDGIGVFIENANLRIQELLDNASIEYDVFSDDIDNPVMSLGITWNWTVGEFGTPLCDVFGIIS